MSHHPTPPLSRRQFARIVAASSATLAAGAVPLLGSCGAGATGPADPSSRSPLPRPATMPASGALVAAAGTARLGADLVVPAWMINGALPSPTIRVRRGDVAQLELVNQLPEATILHWHGLLVPADADGHPRQEVAAGGRLSYGFPIVQRAGTYWYHPHAHSRTAAQVHQGLAGFFLVADAEEDALGLPAGEREVLLMLQDRDEASAAPFAYVASAGDLHGGMLRGTAYGNGVPSPSLAMEPGAYRLRILNGSQARVYRIALGNGAPLTVIGNDGGLLPVPSRPDSVYLGVGERIDCLVDLTDVPVGGRVMLRSLPFDLPTASPGPHPQGMAMDLLELVRVAGQAPAVRPLPEVLSTIVALPAPTLTRTFVFTSGGGEGIHRINGQVFAMNRIDVQVPFNQVERWVFQNDGELPHPVHLHGTQFQVATRTGGRNVVFPHEGGWKDTVLVMPSEVVTVHVRFDAYAGLYLLHCHNLQHEDHGMMLNVAVT